MGMNKEIERTYERAYERAAKHRKSVYQKTFVFNVSDMEGSKEHPNGLGNDQLDEFCSTHHVLSIVFEGKGNRLIYFVVYQ